jgi:hypothetical protein
LSVKNIWVFREEVGMAKKESKEKGGLCCPHCADSKYPCVTMEKQMRKTEEADASSKSGKA